MKKLEAFTLALIKPWKICDKMLSWQITNCIAETKKKEIMKEKEN